MPYNFIPCDRNQTFLMPPDMRDWLPEEDLAWFVPECLELMDLTPFYARYRQDGRGGAAFPPDVMVAILTYAYCTHERSSRRIERLCRRDVGYRIIAGGATPDHATLARFRREYEAELEGLFSQVLELCRRAGMVRVGLVALDGTKMRANASLDQNRTLESVEREMEELARRILDEAEAVDAAEDRLYGEGVRGDELPKALRKRERRMGILKEHAECMRAEQEAETAAYGERLERRRREEEEAGRRKPGSKPRPLEKVREEIGRRKSNLTDPDSRIMHQKGGHLQGYNAQVVVTEDQVILAADVSSDENDWNQLKPMLATAQENLVQAGVEGEIGALVADAGYATNDNLAEEEEEEEQEGPELFIATRKRRELAALAKEEPPPDGAENDPGLTPRQRMERKLLTPRGKDIYKRRSASVEPVFGQIKYNHGFRHFMRRSLPACRAEWNFICACHNLEKLWRFQRQNPAAAAALAP